MSDRVGFVSGGDDCGDGGPCRGRRSGGVVIVEWLQIPKISAGEEEVEPDGERNQGDEDQDGGHEVFCNSGRRLGE